MRRNDSRLFHRSRTNSHRTADTIARVTIQASGLARRLIIAPLIAGGNMDRRAPVLLQVEMHEQGVVRWHRGPAYAMNPLRRGKQGAVNDEPTIFRNREIT